MLPWCCRPRQKGMRVLTRSEGDTVSFRTLPAGDPPDMNRMAIEQGEWSIGGDVPGERTRGDALAGRIPRNIRSNRRSAACGRRGVMEHHVVPADRLDFGGPTGISRRGSHALAAALKTRWSWKSFIPLANACKRMRPAKIGSQKSHDERSWSRPAHGGDPETTGTAASREYPIKEDLAGAHTYGGIIGGKPPRSRQSSPVSGLVGSDQCNGANL